MKKTDFSFKGSDNLDIKATKYIPENPIAVVQIAHGMAEHRKRYDALAKYLVKEGFAVYVNDHRGHGETLNEKGIPGLLADKDGWNKVVEDIHTLAGIIANEHHDLPLVLLGHSMGSFLTRTYIARPDCLVDAAVLSGTGYMPGLTMSVAGIISKIVGLIKGKETPSPLMDKLSFGAFNKKFEPARTGFDWLTRDEKIVDEYIKDPLCGFICTASFYTDLSAGVSRINKIPAFKAVRKELPLYILSGGNDPVGGFSKGVTKIADMYKRVGMKNVTLKIYDGARHEILNETNNTEVFKDLLEWLKKSVHGV